MDGENKNLLLSIIVPALNEEEYIESTIKRIAEKGGERNDYEIIVVNDGSTDKTGQIANDLKTRMAFVRVLHHQTPHGLGGSFRHGVEEARGKYAVMLPGDDETHPQTIENLFLNTGLADVVTTYTVNKKVRNWKRRFISWLYTKIINTLFRLNLKYFNGPSVVRVDLLKRVPAISSSFAYMSDILVRLIKTGYSYKETEMIIRPPTRQSRAFKLKNVKQVAQTIINLFKDIYIKKQPLKYE